MLRPKLCLLLCAGALAACSTVAPSPDTPETVEEALEIPGPGYLVQYATDNGLRTAWLDADGSDFRVVATASSAFAVVDDDLWRWTSTTVEHAGSDCECLARLYERSAKTGEQLDEAQCQTTMSTEVPTLVNLSSDEPLPLEELGDLEQVGDISIEATSKSLAGSNWFGTVCSYMATCGAAHGGVTCYSVVADLESGEVRELGDFMGSEAFSEVQSRLRDPAIEKLEDQSADVLQVTRSESAQLEAGWPVLTGDGLDFVYLFSAPTCYACSDGSWSSYTLGVELREDTVPAPLEALAGPPESVLTFLEQRDIEMNASVGWSELPADGERRGLLLKQFRKAGDAMDPQDTHGDDDE